MYIYMYIYIYNLLKAFHYSDSEEADRMLLLNSDKSHHALSITILLI